jgi:hypothetical protein
VEERREIQLGREEIVWEGEKREEREGKEERG